MDFTEVAAAIKAERELYQAYNDAEEDFKVLQAMKNRGLGHISEEGVSAARAKVSEAITAWSARRKEARSVLDSFLSNHGITRAEFGSLCSY